MHCTSRFAKHASSQSVEEQIDDFDVGISAFNSLRALMFWIRNHHSLSLSWAIFRNGFIISSQMKINVKFTKFIPPSLLVDARG